MEDKVLEQMGNVVKLPGLAGGAMTMPDFAPGLWVPNAEAFDP